MNLKFGAFNSISKSALHTPILPPPFFVITPSPYTKHPSLLSPSLPHLSLSPSPSISLFFLSCIFGPVGPNEGFLFRPLGPNKEPLFGPAFQRKEKNERGRGRRRWRSPLLSLLLPLSLLPPPLRSLELGGEREGGCREKGNKGNFKHGY